MLTWCHIFSTFWRKDSICFIMPVPDINNIYYGSAFRICKDCILYVFRCTQCHFRFLPGFSFPFSYHVQPKLYEMQRTCKFGTCQLNNIRIVREVIQALTDILSVQFTTDRMSNVIEHIRHKDSFVSGKWSRFRKSGLIDVIAASPWRIYPMRTGFQYIVLEIVFMEQQQSVLISFFCKFF